jgi:hypothetical protein
VNAFVALAIGGTEVTVIGYARRPTTLAYAYDGITLCNLASTQWPHATASWGVIDTVLLYDAVTDGTLIATLRTVTPIEIRQYDIARIPAAGITLASGRFGPLGYGAADGSPGVFSADGYDIPVRGAMAMGTFGPGGYGTTGAVPVERAFDQQHVCAPGTWAKAA